MQEEWIQKVKYLKDVQKLSFRQISELLGLGRARLSRMYYGHYKDMSPKRSYLDEVRSLVLYWLSIHPNLKVKQIFQRLKERHLRVSYPRLVEYTRPFRAKKGKVYFPLEFLPGEEAQVDWFFVQHPILGKLCGFAMILSYSRYLFAHLFCRHSFEFFIQGHLAAFKAFDGLPRALRYDNLKSVVLKVHPLTYNPSFLEFARFFGFEIRTCHVACGNEKGRVERVIRHLRETFFNTAQDYQSLDSINEALHQWVAQKNLSPHRVTGKPPIELKSEEKLKAIPSNTWPNVQILGPKQVSKTGFIWFDTNLYSVPDYLCGQWVNLRVFTDRLEIYDAKENRVASHPRSFARHQSLVNPVHRSLRHMGPAMKRERIYSVMKKLDPALESFLIQNQEAGADPFQTAYSLFKLLQVHARATLFSALREALTRKRPHLRFVMSLLGVPQDLYKESVHPQNPQILDIDYQPRALEDYQNDNGA